jgi:hypothetical protein
VDFSKPALLLQRRVTTDLLVTSRLHRHRRLGCIGRHTEGLISQLEKQLTTVTGIDSWSTDLGTNPVQLGDLPAIMGWGALQQEPRNW